MLIGIYTGYSPYFTNDNYRDPEISKNIGGSEYAVIYLSKEFAKLGHEVYIANSHVIGTRETPGIIKCTSTEGTEGETTALGTLATLGSVTYCSFNEFNKLCINRDFDMLIISRYINAFMHCFIRAKKVYLWLHDVIIHDAYQGARLVGNAGPFASNMKCIDGISAQTEWHMETLKQIYSKETCATGVNKKLFLAPNGVDQEIIDASFEKVNKIPQTFIYASHHSRGLQPLLKIWPFIVSKFLNLANNKVGNNFNLPHLYIYGEKIPETDALVNELGELINTVTVFPKTPHLQLFKKMQECEYWIYPTSFPETFCMLALEAQLAGCKCICSDSGALKNTVGKYGIIMPPESTINDWVGAIAVGVDTEVTREQIEYARKQSWKERALMWVNLFNESNEGRGMCGEEGIKRVSSEKVVC